MAIVVVRCVVSAGGVQRDQWVCLGAGISVRGHVRGGEDDQRQPEHCSEDEVERAHAPQVR